MKASETRFNPFPGLRPFGPDEDYLFFGRERQVDELLRRLRKQRFLAVVGTSGSGKSSLVQAGLIPALQGGFMAGAGSRWRIALFRPGNAPIREMARAFNDADPARNKGSVDSALLDNLTEATLRRSALGLVDAVLQARLNADENMLLIVDQFEELFRYKSRGTTRDEDDSAAFVKLLLEGVRRDKVPIFVVLTMRSDFLGDCAQFRDLPETMNDSQFLVPRMTRDQRSRSIESPVAIGGGTITRRLVQRLLNDVGDDPDQLPILQHALMRTWDNWERTAQEDDVIDLTHYEAIGKMAGALSQHGDEIVDALPDERSRSIAERIFKRLTDTSADARGIRRPTALGRLSAICQASEDEVRHVVDAFRSPDRALLMPPVGTPLGSDTIIDISHESLMRVWKQLQRWTNEEAESAQTYMQLADAATRHAEGRLSLWEDPELQLALDWRADAQPTAAWAERYHSGFDRAMAFLEESQEARDTKIREEESRRRRELEQARALAEEQERRAHDQAKATRRLRRLLRITGVLALIAVAGALFAVMSSREAIQQTRLAESRRQASFVVDQLDNRLDLALLLAVEATNAAPTDEARNSLQTALEHSPNLRAFLHGHKAAVLSVAFSPDGRYLASAGQDRSVMLWDVQTRRSAASLESHSDDVTSLAFSSDGSSLASGSWDSSIVLWNTALRQPIRTLRTGSAGISSVAFSPDGTRLASGDRDGNIVLWDLAENGAFRTFTGHTSNVASVTFSPDGRMLASGGWDNTIRIWDTDTGKTIRTLDAGGALVYDVAYSPSGKRLASGGDDGMVRRWNPSTGEQIGAPLRGHQNAVYSVAFSADGKKLASASWDNTVILWDAVAGKRIGTALNGHQEYVSSVAFSPDGKQLASGGFDNTVILWWSETGKPTGTPLTTPKTRYGSIVLGLAFSPDGKRLASSSGDNTIVLWDADTHAMLGKPLRGHRSLVNDVTFSHDGKRLASAGLDNAVIIWDAATGAIIKTLSRHQSAVLSVAFSDDGHYLASSSWDNVITLWNAETLEPIQDLDGHTDAVWSLAFSPHSGHLASGSRDNTIRIWDLTSRESIQTLDRHQAVVYSVAYSADGHYLASGSGDNTIILWNATTYAPLNTLSGHKNYVQRVAFSADSKHLASGSWDHTVRLWDVRTGERIWQLTGHSDVVNSVAFSPTRGVLASGSWDKTVRLWDIETTEPLHPVTADDFDQRWQLRRKTACEIANRNLTHDEWKQFIGANQPYKKTCPQIDS